MSFFFRKAREVTGDLASASKRQAQRGKLELEVRRLEGKVNDEKQTIGNAILPLLEAGSVSVDLPEIHDSMKRIGELLGEIGQRRAEIDALKGDGNDQDNAVSEEAAIEGSISAPEQPES